MMRGAKDLGVGGRVAGSAPRIQRDMMRRMQTVKGKAPILSASRLVCVGGGRRLRRRRRPSRRLQPVAAGGPLPPPPPA